MSESHFAMVSDWMANGSINEFLRGNPDVNRLDLVRLLSEFSFHFERTDGQIGDQLKDVATGLVYIHQRGMIHGDLKGVRLQCREPLPCLTIFPDEG